MVSPAVQTRAGEERSTPAEDPGIQTCLTFAADFGHFRVNHLDPDVATVKEENEAGEAKCVEEGSFQPSHG